MDSYLNTIKNLENMGLLKDPMLISAFQKADRKDFMPAQLKEIAHVDNALPIGYGQTISQPLTVAIMLEILSPREGNKILEIGYGSGWLSAILSYIVGTKGKVLAYEIVKEIAEFGKENIIYHFKKMPANIKLFNYDYEKDIIKNRPYDRIISSAAFLSTPQKLVESLAEKGKFVFPTKQNDIRIVEKKGGKIFETKLPGFVFVPITH